MDWIRDKNELNITLELLEGGSVTYENLTVDYGYGMTDYWVSNLLKICAYSLDCGADLVVEPK